ncbi:MAG: heme exporter protein CcmD [Bauldia sp.]
MDLGEHAGFIIGGYLASFVVIVGLIVLSINRSRRVRAKLEELESRGIRRRSDARPVAGTVPRETKA